MGEVIRKTKNGRPLGWYIRWVDLDGKRKTRASKQPTFAEAKRMLVEIEARVARGKLGVSDTPPRITIVALYQFTSVADSWRRISWRRFWRASSLRA